MEGLRSLLAEETAEVWVFAIKITPKDGGSVEHYVANSEDISLAGDTYTPLPFEVTLAADNEDTLPQVRLRIDNVSQQFSLAVRATNKAPDITLYLVRLSPTADGYLAHVELSSDFTLLSASANVSTFDAVLGYRNDFLNEPAMHTRFTPMLCPALFQ